MLEMKIRWMKIRHFKGLVSRDINPNGGNIKVTAANQKGKTTLADAYGWLLYDKNSEGATKFAVTPQDEDNNDIRGLETSVEAGILINGTERVFKKMQIENLDKHKQVRGYIKGYWIDEVSMLESLYKKAINEILEEDKIKQLSDLTYFVKQISPTDRRKTLMIMAGDAVKPPDGYDELDAARGNRTLDQFKKILTDRKTLDKESLKRIPPRIDELKLGMKVLDFKVDEQQQLRDDLVEAIADIKTERAGVRALENQRQAKIDEVNKLIAKKSRRESELSCDTSGVQDLLDEKVELRQATNKAEESLAEANKALGKVNAGIDNLKFVISAGYEAKKTLTDRKINAKEVKTHCPTCHQPWPADTIKANKQFLADELAELEKGIVEAQKLIDETEAKVEQELAKKIIVDDEIAARIAILEKITAAGKLRVAEINDDIKTRPTPPPEKDDLWIKISKDIMMIELDIGEPVTAQIEKLDAEQEGKQAELDKINALLAQADRIEQDKTRVEELSQNEVLLGQAIADSEKLLEDIEMYRAAESDMITDAVNQMFKATRFKMFKKNLGDDGLQPCCESMMNGRTYPDLSCGERIFVGLDCRDALAKFYEAQVPVFIDNAESMTMDIDAECQTIKLVADRLVSQLLITHE